MTLGPDSQQPSPPASPEVSLPPKPAQEAEEAARRLAARQRRRWWGYLLAVTGLTILATFLRFYRIDRPTLWLDEALTFGRVNGTLDQLLEILAKDDGFLPLHYIVYWWIGQHTLLTPFYMRLVPALAGAAMTPVMWFLARRMLDRKASLLVAAFASVSAFGMAYSRDAKMYIHTWMFLALSTACLLYWLQRLGWRSWLAWLGWVLAGSIAAMLHVTALIGLGLAPLFLLTKGRPRWRDPLLFVVGATMIAVGPVWYYSYQSHYLAKTGFIPSTIVIEGQEERDPNWNRSGLTWIEYFNEGISPLELTLNSGISYAFGLQWPRPRQDPSGFDDAVPGWMLPLCVTLMSLLLGLMALGTLPWSPRWRGVVPRRNGPAADDDSSLPPDSSAHATLAARSDAPVPWWRSALWITAWLVLPTYGVFYIRSTPGFVSPAHWLWVVWSIMGWWWLLALALALGVGVLMQRWRGVALGIALGLWLTLWFTLMFAVRAGGVDWLATWGGTLGQGWLLWPVAFLTPATLWFFSAATLRARMRQLAIFSAVVGILLGMCFVSYFIWDAIWQQALLKKPGTVWQSIWMPRYLGVIYPAVALAIGALVMRLPTRPLRWLAIAFVLGANLTLSLARIEMDTEPPLDRVAVDVVVAMPPDATVRTWLNRRGGGRREGDWLRWRDQGLYYLSVAAGLHPDPHDFRNKKVSQEFNYPVNEDPRRIAGFLRRETRITRIVIWDRFPSDYQPPFPDSLDKALGDQWRLINDERFLTRQFWTWRLGDWYRRREYQRASLESNTDEHR